MHADNHLYVVSQEGVVNITVQLSVVQSTHRLWLIIQNRTHDQTDRNPPAEMWTEQKSHLYFHILDVGREAEDDLGVVCVVSVVPDFDVHVELFFVGADQKAGNISWKL